jgi:hypothetical protein
MNDSCIDTELPKCADCGGPIGQDEGPKDGWQLEDGRTVCQACCVKDTKAFAEAIVSGVQEGQR